MNKVDFYGQIKEEAGVVMAFTKLHEQLGFKKLVPSSNIGFDIDDIDYKGKRVTVEFEYLSENFERHGHIEKMKEGRDYILICYEDNCNIIKRVREKYGKNNLKLIELKKYINIKVEKETENNKNIKYYVLNYNPQFADKKTINDWEKTNMYGLNAHFANDEIIPGSKILFKQGDKIVASCEVVRYIKFDKPTKENEWKLFYALHSYPVGLFNYKYENVKEYFSNGYIFYDEFHIFEDNKISFSKTLVNKKMSRHGVINITKEEYDMLTGN